MSSAGTPAHTQSVYGQLVTSSTLSWVRSAAGLDLPPNVVHSGTGSGVVCRGRHHGTHLVGTTALGRCRLGFTNRLVSVARFQVLTEVPAAAKLQWRPFTRFSELPQGAVAGVEGADPVFVARKLGKDGVMVPAVIEVASTNYGTGTLKVFSDYSVDNVNNGDVLVEIEPVRYELKMERFVKDSKRTSARKILASSSIFRFQEGRESEARMQKMLSYSYAKTQYFGQVKGAIKGLPVTVHLPTGEVKNLLWGMKDTNKQSETIMVGHNMKENSAVDVVISAEEISEEQAYTANLVAVFPDGSVRERVVEGVMLTHFLDGIKPEYSKLYVIKDQIMGPEHSKLSQHSFNLNQV